MPSPVAVSSEFKLETLSQYIGVKQFRKTADANLRPPREAAVHAQIHLN